MKWINRSDKLKKELIRLQGLQPHELLEVPEDASEEIIKKAFRRMAKIYHPDKAGPFMKQYNEKVMKLINSAYEKLNRDKTGV